jgi:ribosome-associated heat shock protein Hsp15
MIRTRRAALAQSGHRFSLATNAERVCAEIMRKRLDKWLWHARVVKARTSAAALVEAGHVRINGVRETAPGHAVKAGDVLTIGLDRSVRVLKITGFSERRGDAASARVLYVDLQEKKQ